MGVLGESSVILIPAVDQPFGSTARDFAIGSFRESPPERIGVKGEYDYHGLAKRVKYSFEQAFGDQVVQLSIGQRGCVVTLTGVVASRSLLNRLVSLAIKVEGAALVEIYSVRFTEDEVVASQVAV
ncbi:MAG: hypothetical protein WA947_05120 [Phormidesmis sp.]